MVRPLVLGKQGDAFVLASETCALTLWGPALCVTSTPEMALLIKMASFTQPFKPQTLVLCFDIYFARPDSILEGRGVYHARKSIGAELSKEALRCRSCGAVCDPGCLPP